MYDAVANGALTLPSLSLVPLNAILTVTRRQNGIPTVAAHAGEFIANGLNNVAVNRAATLMNTGGEWTFVGS